MRSPATTPEQLEAGREAAPSFLSRALALSTVGPLIALLLAVAFFTARTDRFLTGANLSLVVQQVMVVGILACVAFGAFNGTLVTSLRLPPFIVTLGTLNIAFALTHIYSNEQTISNLPTALTFLGDTFTIGQTDITYGSMLMLALFAVAWFVLRQTGAGRHVYAVGNNPEAARLTGIRTRRLLLGVYSTAGLIYGIAALLLVARTSVGDPQAGQTDNLESITAVVLGGTS